MYYIGVSLSMVDWHNFKTSKIMANNKTRSTATQTRNENTNAASKQQVKNNGKNVPAPKNAPVPANLEEVEHRYDEVKGLLSKAKKDKQKYSDKVADLKQRFDNESYALAIMRFNIGKADEEDLAIIANHKVEFGLSDLLCRALGAMGKDSDEVAELEKSAKAEGRSLTSAIAETLRNWDKCYRTLYGNLGVTSKKSITPALVKDLCPFLMVGTADGLKAASVSRTPVKKNGKAVKKDGKRVYKLSLSERKGWDAYGLYELVKFNHRWTKGAAFTEDELKVRRELLDVQCKALAALKAAKEAKKSDVPEQAAEAAKAEGALKDAAKAAGRKAKENAATVGSKEVKVA